MSGARRCRSSGRLTRLVPLIGLSLAAALSAVALWRTGPERPDPPRARIVTDERGHRVAIATPLGTQAVQMGIGLGPYLLVARDPASLVADRSTENTRIVASPYLARVFPDLARIQLSLGTGEARAGDLETLLQANPDVVVTWWRLAAGFERIGLPTVGVRPLASTARLAETTALYAAVVGDAPRGAAILARSRALRAEVAAEVARATRTRPRLLFLLPLGESRWRVGRGFPDVVAEADGEDVGAGLPVNAVLDAERMIALAPEVVAIVGGPAARVVTPARLLAMPALAEVPAVRARRVYAMPPGVSGHMATTMEQPILARWLADILHPELPPAAAAMAARVYTAELGVAPTHAEIDRDLAAAANSASYGGGR